MKILLICNDPRNVGGVVNYTRPLAQKMVELGHHVNLFGIRDLNSRYNWFYKPSLKDHSISRFLVFTELVNSPNLPFNYGNPLIDIKSPKLDDLFYQYLKRNKPDIMHIHAMIGLSASIIEIAYNLGIKVFNTFHVYWYLCQRRVMIDRFGMLCDGPNDLGKCVDCVGKLNLRKEMFKRRIENSYGYGISKEVLKYFFKKWQKKAKEKYAFYENNEVLEALKKRNSYIINTLNEKCRLNICVSHDVRKKMLQFNVKAEKLLVQNIGSTVGEKQTSKIAKYISGKLVFANIGGVNYYKGTHVLIEAFKKLNSDKAELRIMGWYSQEYVSELMKGNENLNIKFFGRYKPENLCNLLEGVHVMVLPSICNDTAPQTIFESFAYKIPIIASNIGGFPDFIKDSVNGFLFEVGNVDELTIKMKHMIENSFLIEKFSLNIQPLKTITQNAKELIELYERESKL